MWEIAPSFYVIFILLGSQGICMYKSLDEFEFHQIPPPTTELAALEHLKNILYRTPVFLAIFIQIR